MKDKELHEVRHLLSTVCMTSSAYMIHFRYISHMKFGTRSVIFSELLARRIIVEAKNTEI